MNAAFLEEEVASAHAPEESEPQQRLEGSEEHLPVEVDEPDPLEGSQYQPEDDYDAMADEDYTAYYQYAADDEDAMQFAGMRILTGEPQLFAAGPSAEQKWVYDSNLRKATRNGPQPDREPAKQSTLIAEIEVNGHKALTLFDSGSTINAVCPEFARVAQLPRIDLNQPVLLQLGCKGSRSKIQFGTTTTLKYESFVVPNQYLDIVNIDRYDMILGTPFFLENQATLDFKTHCIWLKGHCIPCLNAEGEADLAQKVKPVPRPLAHVQAPKMAAAHPAKVGN